MKRKQGKKRGSIFATIKNKLTLKKLKSGSSEPKTIRQYKRRTNETFIVKFKRKIALLIQSFRHNIKIFWIIGILIIGILVLAQYLDFFSYVFRTTPKSTEYVYGLSFDLPAYPGSTFAFPHYKDSKEVEKLKAYNMSCYTLPIGDDFSRATKFYQTTFENMGWTFVGESPISEITQEPGLYFYSEKEALGIRIYSVASDIWYEVITVNDAKQMLANRKLQKQKLIHTIQSLHGEELPDKYRFSLTYSYEYRIQNINTRDFAVDGFSIEKENNKISVIPYRWRSAITPDDALEEYSTNLLETEFIGSDTIRHFPISEMTYNEIAYYIKLIMLDDKSFRIASCVDPKDRIIYIIDGSESDEILFDYLIENMKLR